MELPEPLRGWLIGPPVKLEVCSLENGAGAIRREPHFRTISSLERPEPEEGTETRGRLLGGDGKGGVSEDGHP